MIAGTPSFTTTLFFVLTVAAVASLWVRAVRVLTTAPAGGLDSARAGLLAAGGFVVWLVVPGALARAGLLDRWSLPAPSLVLIAAVTLGTFALAFSPVGARLATSVPLAALVGFQVFRVPVEIVLHRLAQEGVIPARMSFAGSNFDIASGLGAALVWFVLRDGRPHRGLVLAWNVAGLLLLANIVAIAALSTPVAFRVFMDEPANRLPGVFPYVWLPTFLVQAALFGHLLVFRALAARRP